MILAIDIGKVRVGAAILEGHSKSPKPIGAFLRKGDKALQEIIGLIKKHELLSLVVGYPLDASGKPSAQCEDVDRFCHRLRRRVEALEIFFIDEYHSSLDAEAALAGRKKVAKLDLRSKGSVDAMSACIILQRYLNQERLGG